MRKVLAELHSELVYSNILAVNDEGELIMRRHEDFVELKGLIKDE